jgi:hypothetical protein
MAITRPNQVWAMDITYIPIARGFVYRGGPGCPFLQRGRDHFEPGFGQPRRERKSTPPTPFKYRARARFKRKKLLEIIEISRDGRYLCFGQAVRNRLHNG